MRSIIAFAALALVASVAVPRFVTHMNAAGPAPAAMSARPVAAPQPASNNSRSVTVPRDERGHFAVDARVDGRRLGFMVDTGASLIALTESNAAQLGIHPTPRDYVAEVKTANGSVRAARTELGMVEVGDLVVRNVPALVLPDEALSENLLGLSFLSRLRRFEYSDGKLVLEQ
jgi:aspartyl protease family protein